MILDLAICSDLLASADADGRVRTWRLDGGALKAIKTIHESAKQPIAALAATDAGFVGAGASLLSWSREGKVLARAKLPGVATNVVVRGDLVFVLAGEKLLSFALPKLVAKGKWSVSKGVTCELDVDDACTRALVVRDKKMVELIDLKKKKRLADWTRKGSKVESASVRFARDGSLMSACDDDMRLSRVKDLTGRITGEILWLEGFSNGPIALDRARTVAAIGSGGEDVELVALDPPHTRFYLDPRITDAGAKSLAGLKRIPTFKKLAPGFFARHGSVEAPPEPSTLSAMAVGDGGRWLAAGFISGDIVVADTQTGAVASKDRGVLGEPREKARVRTGRNIATTFEVGDEMWVAQDDGQCSIFDLETHAMRAGPKLAGGVPEYSSFTASGDVLTSLSYTHVTRWSRDGALLSSRELPEHRGAYFDGASVLLLPHDSLGHEGFDIVSMDPATGDTKLVVHFNRDASRFALGNDSKGWVRFGRTGTQPTLTIWAGTGLTVAELFAFDLATGAVGRSLPNVDADGPFLARPDFSNPLQPGDCVKVTDIETGAEISRYPYEPGDHPRIDTAAFDPRSKFAAAMIAHSLVAVWRPGASRLVLHGHRGVRRLLIRKKTLVAYETFWVRFWAIA
jgi:hypothetical protein